MTTPVTIEELFKFILFLLGIGVLGFLLVFLKNANNLVSQARRLAEKNEKELDRVLKNLPEISESINCILEDSKVLIGQNGPQLTDMISNLNSISEKLIPLAM